MLRLWLLRGDRPAAVPAAAAAALPPLLLLLPQRNSIRSLLLLQFERRLHQAAERNRHPQLVSCSNQQAPRQQACACAVQAGLATSQEMQQQRQHHA